MSSAMNEPTQHLGTDETGPHVTDTQVTDSTQSTVTSGSTEPARRPIRMHTVVLGMVLLVIAGAVLVSELTDVSVDPGAVVLTLMIGGGLLLIAGARRP